jgi:hypothetical protein
VSCDQVFNVKVPESRGLEIQDQENKDSLAFSPVIRR